MQGTVHPAGGIEKEGGNAPQGHELPTPLRQAVIAGGGPLTASTAPRNPTMGAKNDIDPRPFGVAMQADLLADEAREMLHEVEDGLNL